MADEVTIVVKAEDQFSSVLGDFGNIITGIKSTIDLVGMAFNTARDFLMPFIDSASESEQAVARLEGVLRATGGAVGLTSDELQSMANQLQEVTRFSDETILNGEAILLTFRNIGSEMFERTVPAMVDMAEIFGSVDSAAMQLGKALNDPVSGMGALSRAGITFSDVQKEMIENFVETGNIAAAQNIILSEVENQVGGLAEVMGGTFSGQVDIFKNKLDSLKELIGGPIIFLLGDLFDKFMGLAEANPVFQNIVDFFTLLNERLSSGVLTFLESMAATLRSFSESAPWFEDLANSLIVMQNSLNAGVPLLDALKDTLNDIASGSSPLSGIALDISNFITLGETEGWGEAFVQTISDVVSSADWTPIATVMSGVFSKAIELSFSGIQITAENIDWGSVLSSIWEGLIDIATSIIDQGANALIESMADILTEGSVEDLQGAFQLFFSRDVIPAFFATMYNTIDDMTDGLLTIIVNKFQNIKSADMSEVGEDIVRGLMEGIDSMMDGLLTKIGEVTLGIIDYFKDMLGISSPSTVFAGIGRDIVLGLMQGWIGLFGTFRSLVSSGIDEILRLFAPFLALFGVDVTTGGTTGGASGDFGGFGGTGTTPTGPNTATQNVTNYFYGPVYFNQSLNDTNYDCKSPNGLMTSGSGTLVPHAL